MKRRSVYILEKNGEYYVFDSEENACEFLGVYRKSVERKCRMGEKIQGYSIIKAFSEKDIYSDHRLNGIWYGMKQRCYNPKHPHYHNYGGKGIKVCKAWAESYLNFAKWALKNGYQDGLTIDRLDNDKGYFPANCRWVTYLEQGKNRATNRVLVYKGKAYIMVDLARETGIKKSTLRERLNRGWSVEEAVETPIGGIWHGKKRR